MKDDKVLKNLYILQGLKPPESDKFIADWIIDTRVSLAKNSRDNVGFGSGIKTLQKYMKSNSKSMPELANMLADSDGKNFVFTNKVFAIVSKTNFEMPTSGESTHIADSLVKQTKEAKACCKKTLVLPERWELDAIIKEHSAQGKLARTKYPEYDFGEGLPVVNAQFLFDMMSFFPGDTAQIDENKGALSIIYFVFSPLQGIMLPLNKQK